MIMKMIIQIIVRIIVLGTIVRTIALGTIVRTIAPLYYISLLNSRVGHLQIVSQEFNTLKISRKWMEHLKIHRVKLAKNVVGKANFSCTI